ncbi:MAG: hypothetical protein WA414_19650 [Acidobacteriaceae bacterium]|jgi:hypothetical protein
MERISLPNRPDLALEFDVENRAELGPCPDCGNKTKRIWGYVYDADVATAAYFVEWTPAHPQKDATFDLILGKWGEATAADDRRALSVAFKVLDSEPSFMVQDASIRRIGSSPLVSTALDRNAVLGAPIAPVVFEIFDLIYLADPRIAELRD